MSVGTALDHAGGYPGHTDDHGVLATVRAWEVVGKREIQQLQWAALLARC